MDQIGNNNDDRNRLDEIALKEAIIGLDDREKNILKLRFFRGKTQVEVAQEIGISQAQVSRLEKGAPGKIKKALQQKRVNLCRLTPLLCLYDNYGKNPPIMSFLLTKKLLCTIIIY